jgi:Tfp pilus assembly protein PilV
MRMSRAVAALRQRHERGRARGDAGTTLMELVVVLFLLGLLGSMLTLFTTSTLRSTRENDSQQQDLLQARNALDAMTKNLRAAITVNTSPVTPAFSQASSTSVTFYADNNTVTGGTSNNGPTLMRYYVDNTAHTLVEESTVATVNTGSTTTPYVWNSANKITRVLARNVLNPQPTRADITASQPNGGPVFNYSDKSGSPIATDSSGNVSTLAMGTIQQVEVWISIRSGATTNGITSVVGQAQIVAGYDPDGGSAS